jgi:hypothetical protein
MLAPNKEFLECETPHRVIDEASHNVARAIGLVAETLDMFHWPNDQGLSRLTGEVPADEERCWPMCRYEARYVTGL